MKKLMLIAGLTLTLVACGGSVQRGTDLTPTAHEQQWTRPTSTSTPTPREQFTFAYAQWPSDRTIKHLADSLSCEDLAARAYVPLTDYGSWPTQKRIVWGRFLDPTSAVNGFTAGEHSVEVYRTASGDRRLVVTWPVMAKWFEQDWGPEAEGRAFIEHGKSEVERVYNALWELGCPVGGS